MSKARREIGLRIESRLLEASLLATLAGGEKALVNSHHHQAIEKLGRELVATAWTADGLIEAVEDPRAERFVLGSAMAPGVGLEERRTVAERYSRSLSPPPADYASRKVC